MLQSACATILGSERLVRTLQQPGQQPALFRRLGSFRYRLLFGALFGLLLPLLRREPLLQAHARLRSALRFIGPLAFGQCPLGLQGNPPLAPLFAGVRRWFKGL